MSSVDKRAKRYPNQLDCTTGAARRAILPRAECRDRRSAGNTSRMIGPLSSARARSETSDANCLKERRQPLACADDVYWPAFEARAHADQVFGEHDNDVLWLAPSRP